MDAGDIERVRRFNRTVTERIGVLEETYLDRGRPLAETRLLWEVGPHGADLGELRRRLLLDSGYASRLVGSLEMRGFVRVVVGDADRRSRRVELTDHGRRERAELDRLSDELAGDLLGDLDEARRGRLTAAMDEVEQLLRAAMVTFEAADAAATESVWCVEQYFAELGRRFHTGFDPSATLPAATAEFTPPHGVFVVARLRAAAVGCAGLKLLEGGKSELKRMWISGDCRGLGIGGRLLAEMERRAAEAGARSVRLETNASLVEAVSMYRGAGYREVPPFNAEPYADHWFEKQLKP